MAKVGDPVLRIGELSRRVGVSDHLLRAWEARYGLLAPERSAGGFRLYSERDEARVRRMCHHLARGLSAAEAARVSLLEEHALRPEDAAVAGPAPEDPAPEGVTAAGRAEELLAVLNRAVVDFDETGVQTVLDHLLAEFSLPAALRLVVLPYLAQLGDCWERGEISVGHEHFASNVIRGRLAGLARGWGRGHGPRVVLACPPGELHDLALMAFGIVLSRGGRPVDYLGAATPIPAVMEAVEWARPSLVVLAATTAERFTAIETELARLGASAPLALAGAGAGAALSERIGARYLSGDPVTEAESLIRS